MSFQMNQFKMTDQIGEAMNVNPNTISARVSTNQSGTLKAGDVVKLTTTEAGDLPVIQNAVSGDSGYGVVLFNAKQATYAAGDVVEIALAGSIVTMQVSTGYNRGQLVSWNSVSGKLQSTTGNYIGFALDVTSTAGDISRVFIQPKLS